MSILTMIRRAVSPDVVFLAALALAPGRARAQCPDEWFPIFGVPPGTNGQAFAATLWDPDGSGPQAAQLIAGGDNIASGSTSLLGNLGGGSSGTDLPQAESPPRA
jgi:hypothetical protein